MKRLILVLAMFTVICGCNPTKVEEKEEPTKVEEKEEPTKVEEKEEPTKVEEKEEPVKPVVPTT